MNRSSAMWLVSILIGLLTGVPCPAGTEKPTEKAPAAAGPARADNPGAVELAEQPLDAPGLNLSVRLPVGCVYETTGIGTETRVSVKSSDDPKANAWLLQIYASLTRDAALTTAGVLDSIGTQRQSAETTINPKTRRRMKVRMFDRVDNLVIGGEPASRAYFDIPEDAAAPVTGYTVFNPAPGTFVIFQFDCPSGNVARDRPAIETAIATAVFRDQQAENARRKEGVQAGASLLSTLNAQELDAAALAEPLLLRLFKPGAGADGGDLEIGYQKLTIRKGQLGEVAAGDKTKWTRDQREFGYLVKIEARGLIYREGAPGGEPQAVLDSVSTFWLSSDRANETGSVINAMKRGKGTDTYVQNIVRRAGRLTVQSTGPGAPPDAKDYDKLPEAFINRVELTMLPRLVAARAEPALFNFYCYDFTASKITLRRDEFTKSADGAGWTWTSRPYEAQPDRIVTTDLDVRGNLIRRTADGVTTEPIKPEALRTLWEGRKLPIDGK